MQSPRLVVVAALSLVFLAGSCRERGANGGASAPVASGPVTRPAGPVHLDEARRYVLALVNRDRAEQGLPAVVLDDAASSAGQQHVDDMAKRGFTAHWGSDGSVPEQRYTEAGGTDMVQENAACFFDGQTRELDADAVFDPVALEKIEAAFMAEQPPNDGHRKNILKAVHNRLGVGLAKPVNVDQPCMAQEFVDDYGDYSALPRQARVGTQIEVSGEIEKPVEFGGVGIARIEQAKPRTAEQLNQTSVYAVPEPYVLFFPAGFKTPKPVNVKGNHFSIDVALDDHHQAGRYEVSVWGKYPGNDALLMVSLRTVNVR